MEKEKQLPLEVGQEENAETQTQGKNEKEINLGLPLFLINRRGTGVRPLAERVGRPDWSNGMGLGPIGLVPTRVQTPSPASSFFARQKTWEKNDPHRCKATGQRFYGTTYYMLFSTLKCETNCGYRPFDNARIEERVPRIKPSGMLNN